MEFPLINEKEMLILQSISPFFIFFHLQMYSLSQIIALHSAPSICHRFFLYFNILSILFQ